VFVLKDKIPQLQGRQIRLWSRDWVRMVGKFLIAQRIEGNLDKFSDALVLDCSIGPSGFQDKAASNKSRDH